MLFYPERNEKPLESLGFKQGSDIIRFAFLNHSSCHLQNVGVWVEGGSGKNTQTTSQGYLEEPCPVPWASQ